MRKKHGRKNTIACKPLPVREPPQFGAYPAVSLKDARRKRDRAKEPLANDIDPGAQKKEALPQLSDRR